MTPSSAFGHMFSQRKYPVVDDVGALEDVANREPQPLRALRARVQHVLVHERAVAFRFREPRRAGVVAVVARVRGRRRLFAAAAALLSLGAHLSQQHHRNFGLRLQDLLRALPLVHVRRHGLRAQRGLLRVRPLPLALFPGRGVDVRDDRLLVPRRERLLHLRGSRPRRGGAALRGVLGLAHDDDDDGGGDDARSMMVFAALVAVSRTEERRARCAPRRAAPPRCCVQIREAQAGVNGLRVRRR